MRNPEHIEQVKLFDWLRYQSNINPELVFAFAIPNGGQRNIRTAMNLKAEGVKRGVPDICLPVPKGKYHGLFIELKAGKNKPTPEQIHYIDFLSAGGYKAVVCYGFDEAREVILNYIRNYEK